MNHLAGRFLPFFLYEISYAIKYFFKINLKIISSHLLWYFISHIALHIDLLLNKFSLNIMMQSIILLHSRESLTLYKLKAILLYLLLPNFILQIQQYNHF